jgi:type 1 glutamine amidotransferase
MTRALVLCDDTWHAADTVSRGLAPLADRFAFEYEADGGEWSAERMKRYPLTVLAKANIASSRKPDPWLTSEREESFCDCVRRGGGLVAIHSGCSRYERLPLVHALLGGVFVRHPEPCAVAIEPQPGHPLTAEVPAFTIHDEHYFLAMRDETADVFLRSRSVHGLQPAGWTRKAEAGRVCVLTPGHSLEVWLHPGFQKLLLNACQWAARIP